MDALDAELVEEIVGFGAREVVDAGVSSAWMSASTATSAMERGGAVRSGCSVDRRGAGLRRCCWSMFARDGVKLAGRFGSEGGDGGKGGVDAVEEGGFEAGVVAVGLVEFGAVAVVADIGAAAGCTRPDCRRRRSGCFWRCGPSRPNWSVADFAAEERVGVAFGDDDVGFGDGRGNFSSHVIGEARRDVGADGVVVHALCVDAGEGDAGVDLERLPGLRGRRRSGRGRRWGRRRR